MAEVWVISLRLPGLPAVFTFLRMMKIPGARYTKQNFQDVRSLRRLALETFSLLRYFGSFRLVFLRLRRIVEETRTRSQREHTHTHTHTHTNKQHTTLSRQILAHILLFHLGWKMTLFLLGQDSIASRCLDRSLFSRLVYINSLYSLGHSLNTNDASSLLLGMKNGAQLVDSRSS